MATDDTETKTGPALAVFGVGNGYRLRKKKKLADTAPARTDAGRTLGTMSPRRKAAGELDPGYADAIDRLVEEKFAAINPERRKEAARATEVQSFKSFEEIEAAMTGQPIPRPQGPAPRRWHRY